MVAVADTQSFWQHLDVLRAAIVKIVARSRRVRHRGVLLQGGIVRRRAGAQRRRVHHLPAARPHGGMGGRCGGALLRAADQYGAGAAVHHPHEDGFVHWRAVRFALYFLPVVSVCFPGIIR